MRITKILLCTDFSSAAEAEVEPARALARKFGARVDVVHVCEEPSFATLDTLIQLDGENLTLRDVVRRDAERKMEALLPLVRADHVEAHGRIVFGSPWRTLADIIERERYDLAVVATHGRRGFDRLALGSVAEKLVRHATCPVLVIHAAAQAPSEASTT